ncbi:MAG: bifunctional demethylmenaquinone methyltransferase/2-methoxy-6-polyprenyl-1,4-benzoquinol methylase UbiE [Prolixibacteraceae bacterium]|nr:bifunctional demethylmenaquinone methyltransferase/2-methoxy-6-polyprenyl-1,4-benzoquinol methylase UbiE [Prolixibacteraceae bacterium]
MFNSIARNYDFLNHFLSFGIDIYWRKRLIAVLKRHKPKQVVDIATGTADLAIMAAKSSSMKITGVDFSEKMIAAGRKKLVVRKLENQVKLEIGDAENLKHDDNMFDAGMVAFGIRNFENLEKGLTEIRRVLKNGAPLFILEFSQPTAFPVKQLYRFYSYYFLPFIGRFVSKHRRAYSYLPESITDFISGEKMIGILEGCGYSQCYYKTFTFGIATLYVAHKNEKVWQ